MNDDYRKAFGSVTALRCPTRRGGGPLIVDNGLTAGDTYTECRPGPQTDYAFVCLGQGFAVSRQTETTRPDANWLNIYNENNAQVMRGPFRRSIGTAAQWIPRDTFARIIDGTSNQFFVGEKHISQNNLGRCNKSGETGYVFSGDCSYLGGTANSASAYRTPAMARATAHWDWDYVATPVWFPLAISPTDKPTTGAHQSGFGSYHPGICQFLLGDGVVRGVRVTTPVESILVPYSDVEDGKTVTLD
jgi:hypothetical protein